MPQPAQRNPCFVMASFRLQKDTKGVVTYSYIVKPYVIKNNTHIQKKGLLWIWVNAENNLLSWGRPFHISSQTTLKRKMDENQLTHWPQNFGFRLHENQVTVDIRFTL